MRSYILKVSIVLVLVAFAIIIAWHGRGPSRPAPSPQDSGGVSDAFSGGNEAPAGTPQSGASRAPATEQIGLQGVTIRLVDGKPIAGVGITPIYGEQGSERPHITSAVDGSFQIPLEGRALRMLRTEHPDYVKTTFVLGEPLPGNLELPLIARGSFRAKVIDAQSGTPVSGARLVVEDVDGREVARVGSDSAGAAGIPIPEQTIHLLGGRAPREAVAQSSSTLVVEAEGYQPQRKAIALPGFDTGPVQVLVSLESMLRRPGRVVAPNGQTPVPHARVFWTWRIQRGLSSEKEWNETVADERGAFEWSGPGITWETILVADAPDFAPGSVHVELPDLRAGRDLVVTLSRPCTFTGSIVNEEGSGVGGVAVKLFTKDPPPSWTTVEFLIARYARPNLFTARTNVDGTFSLSGVPAGTYFVRWLHRNLAGGREGENPITLPRASPWEGKVLRGESIGGICVSADGDPLPQARIYLRVHDEAMPNSWRPVSVDRITYDGQGMFHAFGLEKARHEITATAGDQASEPLEVEDFPQDLVLMLKPQKARSRPGNEKLTLRLSCQDAALEVPWIEVNLAPVGTLAFDQRVAPVKLGVATIEHLAPGCYDLQVNGYGYAPILVASVELPRASPLPVSLEVAPFVYGTVVVKGNERPHFIDVCDLEGRSLRHVPIGPSGAIVIPGLPRGEYQFRAKPNGRVAFQAPARALVEPGQELTIELTPVTSADAPEVAPGPSMPAIDSESIENRGE